MVQMRSEYVNIVKENKGIIYKITKIYTDTRDDQQDLYQEILYQLWKSFDTFNNNSKISTWIYKVALNTSLAYLNQKKRQPRRTDIEEIIHEGEDKQDSLMEDRIDQMYQLIKKLNEGERGMILLHLDGKSYEEISIITGFSVSNVGTKLNRIRLKLKNQIIK
jgi:RNA polymerase sigma-70 factor, ECF subfamily